MSDSVLKVLVAIAFILAGLILGIGISNDMWRGEAIQHNCAHYDGQTGDFKWNK